MTCRRVLVEDTPPFFTARAAIGWRSQVLVHRVLEVVGSGVGLKGLDRTIEPVLLSPKNPWALHGRGRTLHSRGPGPQNPICLRARILRECKKNTKPGAQTLRSQPDWSRTKPGLVRVQTPPENSGPTPAYEGPGASGWFPILVNGQTDFQGPYIIDPSDSFHHHLLSRGERVAPISDDHEINPKTKQAVPST